MKFLKFALIAGFAFTTTVAQAGGLAPAVLETVEMVDAPAPTSSLGNLLIPLLFLALVAAAASSSDESSGSKRR